MDSSAWLNPRTVCGLHGSARSLKAALCSWEPRHCSYRKRWERGVGRRAVGPPRELSTRKPPPVRTGRAESGPLDPARCLLCCYTCGGRRGGTAVASETVCTQRRWAVLLGRAPIRSHGPAWVLGRKAGRRLGSWCVLSIRHHEVLAGEPCLGWQRAQHSFPVYECIFYKDWHRSWYLRNTTKRNLRAFVFICTNRLLGCLFFFLFLFLFCKGKAGHCKGLGIFLLIVPSFICKQYQVLQRDGLCAESCHSNPRYRSTLNTCKFFLITINTIYIGTNIVMHRVMKPSSVSVHGF